MNGGSDHYKTSSEKVWWELSDAYIEIAVTDFGSQLSQHKIPKKCTFLDYSRRTITQEGNMEKWSHFFIYVLRSNCNIHFCIWKKSKFIYVWCSSFGPFWSVKYVNFGQKLIRTAHRTFLKSEHLRLLKIHITFCPLMEAKEKRH